MASMISARPHAGDGRPRPQTFLFRKPAEGKILTARQMSIIFRAATVDDEEGEAQGRRIVSGVMTHISRTYGRRLVKSNEGISSALK